MTAAPTLAEVERLMDKVENETIGIRFAEYKRSGELAADPVLDSAKELFGKLREAVRQVALRGRETAQQAVDAVVETWERLRDKLGSKAEELLKLFQEQVWLLVSGVTANVARYLPSSLDVAWANELDTVSAKLAWSVSPSVRIAVDGWLAIAVGNGFELTATYKRRTDNPVSQMQGAKGE